MDDGSAAAGNACQISFGNQLFINRQQGTPGYALLPGKITGRRQATPRSDVPRQDRRSQFAIEPALQGAAFGPGIDTEFKVFRAFHLLKWTIRSTRKWQYLSYHLLFNMPPDLPLRQTFPSTQQD